MGVEPVTSDGQHQSLCAVTCTTNNDHRFVEYCTRRPQSETDSGHRDLEGLIQWHSACGEMTDERNEVAGLARGRMLLGERRWRTYTREH